MDLSTIELVMLGIIGVVAGWINVMAGGGSLMTVPVMLFMGMPAPVANGTNRIGILFQNISAIYGFFKKGFKDFKLSLSLSLFACIGAIGGANVGIRLDGVWFNTLLTIIMITTIALTLKNTDKIQTKYKPQRIVLGHILMIGVGFWGGMIQIGTGFILMPILNKIMHLDLVHTNMHKVFIVFSYTIVSLTIFANNVEIAYQAGLALAIGTSIGGYLGAYLSITKGNKWIRVILYIVLSIFIIKLLTPLVL